jgi:hypothetical protein
MHLQQYDQMFQLRRYTSRQPVLGRWSPTNKHMKPEPRIFLCGIILLVSLLVCLAHDNEFVHPAMSESAAKSSGDLINFLTGNFGYSLEAPTLDYSDPDGASGSKSPLEWIKEGSNYEDITRCENLPSIRGNNHFYDPIHKLGLTDGIDLGARSSFRWATENLDSVGGASYPWPAARAFELSALTNSSSAERKTKLAQMLFYLGHIIHLNQDLTVPAHVRNDNHWAMVFFGIMWTENYGRDHYKTNSQWFDNRPHGWSWWQNAAGFQKLEDFWNRGLLITNKASALNSDAGDEAGKELGLAEFCNGNFISEDSPYGEFFYFHGKHWFQYPSLADTSQPKLSPYNLADSVDKIELRNHKEGNRLRIRKTGAGINVTNHSALNYLAVKNTPRLGNSQMQVTLTIHDDKVLQEYHEKLIPKTIEYSAGILDYFFRGKMDVAVSWGGTNAPNFTNTVQNTSGQDFHGGTYFLLLETNGVRSPLLHTNLADLLQNPDASFTNGMKLNILCDGAPTNKLLLVYQGTIGWTNNAPLDPVDSNICIAVARPWIKQIKTHRYWDSLSAIILTNGLCLTNGSTIISNLVSDDFSFTPTPGNVEVMLNGGFLDDSGTIGFDDNGSGGISFPFTGTCGGLAPIEPNIIVPASGVYIEGNHLRVNIRVKDAIDCGSYIGWVDINITWRAWPAQ